MSLRVGCGIDYVTGLCYKDSILAHGGASSRDDPVGGAGSGVLRPRLVTAGSGGPGHRPPGIMTWLRGASLYGSGGNAGDGSAAPGRKSPRWSAERRASRVMGRAAPHSRGSVASRKRDNRDSAPVGAPPTPLRVGCEGIETNPGAATRRGNEETHAV